MFKLISLLLLTNVSYADIDQVLPHHPELILDERVTPHAHETYESHLGDTQVRIVITQDDYSKTITHDKVDINCEKDEGTLSLENRYFKIRSQSVFYISGPITCNKLNVWMFEKESSEAQVLEIYHQALTARNKFLKNNIADFWTRKINIKWPSNGDYYSWGTVNITRGDHWDVVAHEIGHAIYDQANIGISPGGRHRIDECYSSGLALSEGWATFFAGWLNLSLNDRDARFEYLVPRRAPIRLENIPADVCPGQTNEWRVAGFFWDLIDHSEDGESVKLDFKDIWRLKLNKNHRSTKSFANDLESQMDPILLRALWKNNFLTEFD